MLGLNALIGGFSMTLPHGWCQWYLRVEVWSDAVSLCEEVYELAWARSERLVKKRYCSISPLRKPS